MYLSAAGANMIMDSCDISYNVDGGISVNTSSRLDAYNLTVAYNKDTAIKVVYSSTFICRSCSIHSNDA